MKRRIVVAVLAILFCCFIAAESSSTVTELIPRVQYTASGSKTFTFAWPIWDSDEIRVYDNTDLVSSSLYSVTFTAGDPLGGSVVFDTAPTVAHTITIVRRSLQERTTDFALSGPFSMSTMNTQIDRVTGQVQDLQEQISRAVTVEITQDVTVTAPPTMPAASEGAWIRWDANGNFENFTPTLGLCTVSDAQLQTYVDQFLGDVNYSQGLLAADPNVTDQGDTGESTSLAALFVVLAGDPASIEIPGNSTYTATTTLVVPGGTEFRMQRGAILDGTITWPNTFPGASILAAPDQKIFAATLTQNYFPAVDVIHPGWWGAYPDGSTDATDELQAAIDKAGGGGPPIQLLPGTYLISDVLTLIKSGIHIRGSTVGQTTIKQTTTAKGIFQIGDGTNPAVSNLTIEHVKLWTDADAGNIFEMAGTGGLYDSSFREIILKQENPAKYMFVNSNKGDYVNVVWDHFAFEADTSSAVSPFLLETNNYDYSRGTFTNGIIRDNNTQFFWISALLTGYFVNDFTFSNIRVEDSNAGLLYAIAANNLVIENVGFYGVTTTTNHLIEIDASVSGEISQNVTLRNISRHGGSLGGAFKDILLDTNEVTGVLIEMTMDDAFTNYAVDLGDNNGVTIIDPLSTTTWSNVSDQTIRINPKNRAIYFGPSVNIKTTSDGIALRASTDVHSAGKFIESNAKVEPGTGNRTITAAQLLTGIIDEDPEGNATWTTATAAQIVAAINDAAVSDTFSVIFHNDATDGSGEVVTLAGGTGVTLHGAHTKLTEAITDVGTGNETALVIFRLVNVTPAAEAVDAYIFTGSAL